MSVLNLHYETLHCTALNDVTPTWSITYQPMFNSAKLTNNSAQILGGMRMYIHLWVINGIIYYVTASFA